MLEIVARDAEVSSVGKTVARDAKLSKVGR